MKVTVIAVLMAVIAWTIIFVAGLAAQSAAPYTIGIGGSTSVTPLTI